MAEEEEEEVVVVAYAGQDSMKSVFKRPLVNEKFAFPTSKVL